jgi:small subunit ribosomal protein S16
MQRLGRKNLPFYRIAVFDARTKRDGKYIEKLGFYDPLATDDARRLVVDVERYQHWVGLGAQTSEAVASLLRGIGVTVPVPGAGKRARRARRRKRKAAGAAG